MSKIALIIAYMGNFPWYFPYFLHSCRYNPDIDFLIFTDNKQEILMLNNPGCVVAAKSDNLSDYRKKSTK
jgi:hypothetical protein